MTGCAALVSALEARGVADADVAAVVREAELARGGFGSDEPVFEFLQRRLDPEEFGDLVDTVAAAAACGPDREPFRSTWRVLHAAGCPYDRLWRNLFHACNDPTSDPQDVAWLPQQRCLEAAQRAVALDFPFRECAAWPGIGCQAMLQSALDGTAQLLRLKAPYAHILDNARIARQVISPAIAAIADAAATIADAAASSDDASVESLDPLERLDLVRWFEHLQRILVRPDVVVDPVVDRFCFETERVPAPQHAPRAAPPAPEPPSPRVRAMFTRNRRWEFVPWSYGSFDELDWMGPVRWLELCAEDLVVLDYEPGALMPVLREPRG